MISLWFPQMFVLFSFLTRRSLFRRNVPIRSPDTRLSFFPDWSVIFFRSFVISRRSSQAAKGASLEHLRSFHHKVPLWWENKEKKKKKKHSFFKIAANQVSWCRCHPTVKQQLLPQPSWTYPSVFCYSFLSFETNRPLFLSKHMTCRCFINPPCNFFGHIFLLLK